MSTKRYKLQCKSGKLYLAHSFLIQLINFNNIRIDDFFFRMHYKISIFIITFVYLMYLKTLYKYDVMSCSTSSAGKANENFAAACFANSVYSVHLNKDDVHIDKGYYDAPYSMYNHYQQGISFEDLDKTSKKQDVRYHKYYQFVPFVLLVQIIIFITPRYLWRSYEDRKMKMLCEEIQGPVLNKGKEEYLTKKKNVAEYFVSCLGHNNTYAFVYAGCELLNMIGVVFQMHFLDVITGNVFSTHGIQVIMRSVLSPEYSKADGGESDPLSYGFPTLAKCTFNTYGPSGNVVPNSGVCTLPLNLVTKIYLAWFWLYLIVLTIFNAINMIYRVATIASFQLRFRSLKDYALIRKSELRLVMKSCLYGDWFILTLLAQNLDSSVFNDIVGEMVNMLQEAKDNV